MNLNLVNFSFAVLLYEMFLEYFFETRSLLGICILLSFKRRLMKERTEIQNAQKTMEMDQTHKRIRPEWVYFVHVSELEYKFCFWNVQNPRHFKLHTTSYNLKFSTVAIVKLHRFRRRVTSEPHRLH